MQDRLVFLIGAPLSGSARVAQLLGLHPQIAAPIEPHLITPLAHLGYFARVERAAYDPILTEAAMRELVAALPGGERDYLDALRACSDRIYAQLLAPSGRSLLLDATPAYALVLDFLAQLYPRARYVVVTRNPLAIWCAFARSALAGGDAAQDSENPRLERCVPAIARFLRERAVPICHVRYEDLAGDPEAALRSLCGFLGIEFAPAMLDGGARSGAAPARWADAIAGDAPRLQLARRLLERLLDPDLETWGFRRAEILAELERAAGLPSPARRPQWSRSALERRLLVALRRNIHQNALGRALRQVRRACDVLLR